MAGDCKGKSLSHLEIGIKGPKPERDSDAGIHHVEKNDEGVGLRVEETPHDMGERLLEGELLRRGEGVTVDTESLVHQEEANHKSRSYWQVAIWLEACKEVNNRLRGDSSNDGGTGLYQRE